MIIAKSALLDRENAQEVDKFNKLIEDYYNEIFIVGESNLSQDQSKDVSNLMAGFRKQFRDKDLAVKPSKEGSLKGQEFSTDITKLGDIVKQRKKK